jgi:AGZA family xanthine/uracil permease-like MFS transporter
MTVETTAVPYRPAWWVAGDWNGFFGLFTNVALNVIVLTGLCLGVVKMPENIVFGRVLPALGIALPIGNLFCAWLAYQLGRREGRGDVTALPYGPSVPHMFIVVFLVMLPVYLKTNDPILAWQAGLGWAFIIGCIILLGAFVGPTLRKYTPRAAMLGALAGIAIAFISMRPAFLSWQVPWLAFVSLAIILISWTAGVRLPGGVPGGLAAVLVGTALGWIATLTGISSVMDPHAVGTALAKFGVHPPIPSLDFLHGLGDIGPLLVVAVPLGIYNFTEGMNNVESAGAAGDQFDLRKVLLADGIGALAGALLGSPFPPAVYIGHPGWKAVGGRIGYSLATGVVISLVCFAGLTALLLAVVPLVAILPILLYIGLVIGAQAFESTPARHAPAVILAMLPNIASWAQNQIDGALSAAGTSASQVGFDKLAGHGVIYHGLELFGGGGTLTGLMLGAVAAFIIDRAFDRAAIYALGAAVLAFFGVINGTALGFGNSSSVALGYLLVAAICLGMRYYRAPVPLPIDDDSVAREPAGD